MQIYDDISHMFSFVINSFTWEYQEEGIIDRNLYPRLKPCISIL